VHSAATLIERVAAAQAEEEDDSRRWAGLEWLSGPNATWAGAERKKREMGCKDDCAKMILGCAEKKKKVFRF
jgi:hypothetical protein